MPSANRTPVKRKISKSLLARFAKVRLFLCDVDGVLTDATVFIGGQTEVKAFNILDGLGMKLLEGEGIKVGWISNRPSQVTTQRGAELKISFVVQNKHGETKLKAAEQILAKTGLSFDEVCYIGDDIVDLALMKRVGVAVGVPNGIDETHEIAHYVTEARGGCGAVREVAVMILKAQKKWDRIVQEHLEA